jgi:hypothetical protein
MLHIRIQTPMYVACTEVYRFEQRCADLNRGVLILTGVYLSRGVQIWAEVYRFEQRCTEGVYRFEQRCTDLSRGVQIWAGVYRFDQRCTDLNRGVQIWTEVYRFEQRCTDLNRGVQIWTEVYRFEQNCTVCRLQLWMYLCVSFACLHTMGLYGFLVDSHFLCCTFCPNCVILNHLQHIFISPITIWAEVYRFEQRCTDLSRGVQNNHHFEKIDYTGCIEYDVLVIGDKQ